MVPLPSYLRLYLNYFTGSEFSKPRIKFNKRKVTINALYYILQNSCCHKIEIPTVIIISILFIYLIIN